MSFSPLWLVLCVLTISDASAAGTTPSVRLAKLQSWPLTPLTKFANLFVERYGMQRIMYDTLLFSLRICLPQRLFSDGPIRLMDGTTVEVADSPMSDKNGGYFLRYLFSGDNVVASMRLKAPDPLESSQLDSTKWKLNYKILDFTHYATTMIGNLASAFFMSDSKSCFLRQYFRKLDEKVLIYHAVAVKGFRKSGWGRGSNNN
ncbi:unnamed protein product [Cylicostephanus goldi]|uniref:Uncharacterized protein n=1 Tax=Cylicostephanus goldi TaxID=71465 RepID=A0A3P7MP83_CYLGO|nr:unnamed protein product [Cylicostephanus goldi]